MRTKGDGMRSAGYIIRDKHITLTVEPGAKRYIMSCTYREWVEWYIDEGAWPGGFDDGYAIFYLTGTTTLTLDGGSGLLLLQGNADTLGVCRT